MGIFPTALQVSVHFMLILTQYQAHPPQLGLLVVSGLHRLANFNLSIGPLRTKLFNNMASKTVVKEMKKFYGHKEVCIVQIFFVKQYGFIDWMKTMLITHIEYKEVSVIVNVTNEINDVNYWTSFF